MRFKCKMVDAGAMKDFTNIAHTVARMSKTCVLRLTEDFVCFNVADEKSIMVWTTLKQSHFFTEYIITGKSDEHNEIYMELNTAMLAKSVTSFKTSARSVKIKLTNKQQPCLTFEIELSSLSAESRICTHDLPITVIPQKRWKEYDEPKVPQYDISLEMPQFKVLKSVIERIKNMSPILIITAESSGTISFKVDTDTAILSVLIPDLSLLSFNSEDEDEKISANVDIKKFHAFLAWEMVHPTKTTCNIVKGRVVNLDLSLDEYVQIKYFIPAVSNT